jgi:iron(III) transport system ATP-binding protein
LKRSEHDQNMTTSVGIEGVVKRFGSFRALDDVNLSIASGEFFTLLGPSGCGKTTLLRCIAGFEKASEGHIVFNGEDTTGVPPWEKNIGFVFQNYALWPNKTVFANVAYGLEIRRHDRAYIRAKVEQALDLLDLHGIGEKMPETLSGGQQQRVAIARALVIDPTVLLLDEPLSNLDAKLRITLRFEIKKLQRKLGITAVYVTHDQEEALEISDKIAIINKGRVLQVGTPEDIYERPADRFVADFVGKANIVAGQAQNGRFVCSDRLSIPFSAEPSLRPATALMFRPEALEEISSGQEAHIEGTVIDSLYRGNLRRYLVDANCASPIVYETGKAHEVGDYLRLAIRHYRLYE